MIHVKVLIVEVFLFHLSRGQSDGDLRLANSWTSGNSIAGRLEVYHSGSWGTVCDDDFGSTDAIVACKQLGYSTQNALQYTSGCSSAKIWMDDLACDGDESKLRYCSHSGWGIQDCNHGEDVGVRCYINKVNGDWGSWNSWDTCSRTCGNGYQKRIRFCNNPTPSKGGTYCSGNAYLIRNCHQSYCQVNGGWASWNSWGTCSRTCGNGYQKRIRYCNNPRPSNGGTYCSGNAYQIQNCHRRYCQVAGKWGSWSEWGQCNASCGEGKQRRARSCTSPAPTHGGSYCSGDSIELQACSLNKCPVSGIWSGWTAWNGCGVSCGGGLQQRKRNCDNPLPENGGHYCNSTDTDIRICNTDYCPVDGNWGQWSTWGSCNDTCGSGIQSRYRRCDNPAPYFGGVTCTGLTSQIQPCNESICPSQDETQYSTVMVVGVAVGCVVGTLILVLIGYCAGSKIKHLKHGKQEKLCSQNREELRKARSRENDYRETVELPCNSTRSGINDRITGGRQKNYRETVKLPFNSTRTGKHDRVTLGPQNDYRETVKLPCNSTGIGQHEKVTNAIYDNQLFMEEDTEDAYENLKI